MRQRFLAGVVFASLISLGPVMLIYHRSLDTFLYQQSWQNIVFYVMAIFFGGLAVTKGVTEDPSAPETTTAPSGGLWFQIVRRNEFPIFISWFFFFYVACCALCQKLDFTLLPSDIVAREVWKTLGLLIMLLAMAIQVRIFPLVGIAHPIYLSCLLLLSGLPFLFSVWMPLFAVPGAFIIFKWRIKMQDKRKAFLAEASLQLPVLKEESNGKQRWQLLPYIF